MRNQYFGDINDYRKYGLLRALHPGHPRQVVAWMLTPDAGAHGGRTGYLDQPERYRPFDPPLFDALRGCLKEKHGREVRCFERSNLLPGARFISSEVPRQQADRARYFAEVIHSAAAADLVFLDPDVGLAPAAAQPRGKKATGYLFPEELRALVATSANVALYQHWPVRKKREEFEHELTARLRELSAGRSIHYLRTSHVLFVLMAPSSSENALVSGLGQLEAQWGPQFEHTRPEAETADALSLSREEVRQTTAQDRSGAPRGAGPGLSNVDLVTLAVYSLGGSSERIDTEDIAKRAHELAPGRLVWRKYPDQINLELVRVYLSDAKKAVHGAFIIGSGRSGWMLTERGTARAAELSSGGTIPDFANPRASTAADQRNRAERTYLLSHPALESLRNEGLEGVAARDLESLFRLDEYMVGAVRERRIARVLNAVADDPVLIQLLTPAANQVRSLRER